MELVAPKNSVTNIMRWAMYTIIFMLWDYLWWFAVLRALFSVLRVRNPNMKSKRRKIQAKREAEKEAERGATKNMSMEQMSLYYET